MDSWLCEWDLFLIQAINDALSEGPLLFCISFFFLLFWVVDTIGMFLVVVKKAVVVIVLIESSIEHKFSHT